MGEYCWYDYGIPLIKSENIHFAFNYAVVKLDRCIGHKTGYWPCAKQYNTQWNSQKYWRRIGYQCDFYNKERPFYTKDSHAVNKILSTYSSGSATTHIMPMDLWANPLETCMIKSGDIIYAKFNGQLCIIGLANLIKFDLNNDGVQTADFLDYWVCATGGGTGLVKLIEDHQYCSCPSTWPFKN